jgi:hypothetical protein
MTERPFLHKVGIGQMHDLPNTSKLVGVGISGLTDPTKHALHLVDISRDYVVMYLSPLASTASAYLGVPI